MFEIFVSFVYNAATGLGIVLFGTVLFFLPFIVVPLAVVAGVFPPAALLVPAGFAGCALLGWLINRRI